MNKKWIFVGIALLVCVLLFVAERFLRQTESFLSTGTCPAGFTFFVDLKGGSYCCNGQVKDKKCTAKGPNTFCGLAPNLPDPSTGRLLPTCTKMMEAIAADTSGKYCNKEMPNYIAPGLGPASSPKGGCSVAPATGNGSIFPVGPDGNRPATPFCVISGKQNLFDLLMDNKENGRFNCETVKLKESIKCPTGLYVGQDSIQQGGFINCKSSQPYDSKTGNPHSCIPDEVLALFPRSGTNTLIGLEFAKTICSSCSYYKKRFIEKDTTTKCVN